jgi:hypothetical protein
MTSTRDAPSAPVRYKAVHAREPDEVKLARLGPRGSEMVAA